MRLLWWHSIRWQLALGSLLVSFLATGLLACTALLTIAYYYSSDQRVHMQATAANQAYRIGATIRQAGSLRVAVGSVLPTLDDQPLQEQQYIFIVLDRKFRLIYPDLSLISTPTRRDLFVRALVNPETKQDDIEKLRQALQRAMEGQPTSDELGKIQPYVVQPILMDGQKDGRVAGVLMVLPLSVTERTMPPFIRDVGAAVLLAVPFVAVLVAALALFFARTITRPLRRLTLAAHELASGNYDVQVPTHVRGELGDLSYAFAEMSTQLKKDVEELKRQELWRRELIMNVTHDLATPLTAIAGLGESLVDGVNQSREDYEATGRIITRETLRLRRLVKDLHLMARVEAGALLPQYKSVRLPQLIDEVLAVLAPEFERVEVEPLNTLPYSFPVIKADPDMLTRVLSNLCDNALKHTPAGGTVTLAATAEQDKVTLSVTDTGPGIPPAALPRVFERFYRADSSRQSQTGGSGLGLAIVKAIVEAHGGKVWAENVAAPTIGARFVFTLPVS